MLTEDDLNSEPEETEETEDTEETEETEDTEETEETSEIDYLEVIAAHLATIADLTEQVSTLRADLDAANEAFTALDGDASRLRAVNSQLIALVPAQENAGGDTYTEDDEPDYDDMDYEDLFV